jgi:hypothetical protein
VDALRQDLACRSQETHLTLLFVAIDANICHRWSLLCGMDRVMTLGYHVWVTGRFISSLLLFSLSLRERAG